MSFPPFITLLVAALIALQGSAAAQKPLPREFIPPPFDQYLEQRVRELSSSDWQEGITPENWPVRQAAMRKDLRRMLGLDPLPERTPLQPVVTGMVQGDGYVVEKLHFQSSPGLYVTGNLYRPQTISQPLPTILYVCGHGSGVEDGVRVGNKTAYQHHAIWFARNGYVCLVLDTIQLGEIAGDHHGTYRLGRWWWVSRGYTPAGVEAWNGIRALDYLETRPEVDATRLGITGRSGGGAYTWWIAALDERIKVAVPTAGITTLHNHVVDGAIEGHCDCMFMVNTERWDFDRVAALLAPRPLLIANTDSDDIFPLDGVVEIYRRTRALYRLLGKEPNIGLHIAEGPHKDTQPLHTGAFHWLNRFLKGGDPMDALDVVTQKEFPLKELKVFSEIPADEMVTKAGEFFVPAFEAGREMPTKEQWTQRRDGWLAALRTDCFHAWPEDPRQGSLGVVKRVFSKQGLQIQQFEILSESSMPLPLWIVRPAQHAAGPLKKLVIHVLDDASFAQFRGALNPDAESVGSDVAELQTRLSGADEAIAFFCPRGVGAASWKDLPERKRTHLLRRLQLLGETLESGQVWDIRQAIASLTASAGEGAPILLRAERDMAANALYASLFIPGVQSLELEQLPASHRDGPTYLNVLRHLDIPEALVLASERARVELTTDHPERWQPAVQLAEALGFGKGRIEIRDR